MKDPGVWYLIGDYSSYSSVSSVASEARRRVRPIPPGKWEFKVGLIPPEEVTGKPYGIWARYLGPERDLKRAHLLDEDDK
jgi:hypothetical protein